MAAVVGGSRPWFVGERIRDADGFAGTVRYIGSVASAKDQKQVYIGVEWDDATRGKHDGSCVTSDGQRVRHFTCRDGAGSFVKQKLLKRAETFAEVMQRRYVPMDAEMVSKDNKLDMEQCNVKTWNGRALPIEFYGELKIRARQQTGLLERVTCRDDMVGLAGDDAGTVVPNLWLLDLQGNLIADWQELAKLGKQLPLLTTLRINGNRMYMPSLGPGVDALAFPNLTVLVLNSCGITSWGQVALLEQSLPSLEALSLAYNDLSDIEQVLQPTASEPMAVQELAAQDGVGSSRAVLGNPGAYPPVNQFGKLRHLDLSNVGLSTWRQVLRFARLPCLEQLHLTDNSIPSVWPLEDGQATEQVTPFEHVESISLSGNLLSTWESIDALNSYKSHADHGGIRAMRLGGKMPLLAGLGASEVRIICIARLPLLGMLNGSIVREKERVEAEKTYLRRVLRDIARACKLQAANTGIAQEVIEGPEAQAVVAQHPRFAELHARYGAHVSASAQQGTGTIAAETLTLTLRSMAANSIEKDPVTKKLPSSMAVVKLKQLCKRLFDLDPELQVLYYETGDRQSGLVPTFLDDDSMALGFFGVPDGATIIMNEVDLKQQEREKEAWAEEQRRREEQQERRLLNFNALRLAERGAELRGVQAAAANAASS